MQHAPENGDPHQAWNCWAKLPEGAFGYQNAVAMIFFSNSKAFKDLDEIANKGCTLSAVGAEQISFRGRGKKEAAYELYPSNNVMPLIVCSDTKNGLRACMGGLGGIMGRNSEWCVVDVTKDAQTVLDALEIDIKKYPVVTFYITDENFEAGDISTRDYSKRNSYSNIAPSLAYCQQEFLEDADHDLDMRFCERVFLTPKKDINPNHANQMTFKQVQEYIADSNSDSRDMNRELYSWKEIVENFPCKYWEFTNPDFIYEYDSGRTRYRIHGLVSQHIYAFIGLKRKGHYVARSGVTGNHRLPSYLRSGCRIPAVSVASDGAFAQRFRTNLLYAGPGMDSLFSPYGVLRSNCSEKNPYTDHSDFFDTLNSKVKKSDINKIDQRKPVTYTFISLDEITMIEEQQDDGTWIIKPFNEFTIDGILSMLVGSVNGLFMVDGSHNEDAKAFMNEAAKQIAKFQLDNFADDIESFVHSMKKIFPARNSGWPQFNIEEFDKSGSNKTSVEPLILYESLPDNQYGELNSGLPYSFHGRIAIWDPSAQRFLNSDDQVRSCTSGVDVINTQAVRESQ